MLTSIRIRGARGQKYRRCIFYLTCIDQDYLASFLTACDGNILPMPTRSADPVGSVSRKLPSRRRRRGVVLVVVAAVWRGAVCRK